MPPTLPFSSLEEDDVITDVGYVMVVIVVDVDFLADNIVVIGNDCFVVIVFCFFAVVVSVVLNLDLPC